MGVPLWDRQNSKCITAKVSVHCFCDCRLNIVIIIFTSLIKRLEISEIERARREELDVYDFIGQGFW